MALSASTRHPGSGRRSGGPCPCHTVSTCGFTLRRPGAGAHPLGDPDHRRTPVLAVRAY